MRKLHYKLVLALVVLIIIVLVCLGLLIGQLFKNYYINSFHNQFEKEGAILTQIIEKAGGISDLDLEDLQKSHDILQARITILQPDGTVTYDSGDSVKYYNHSEVIEAIIDESASKDSGLYQVGRGFDISYYWERININGEENGLLILSSTIKELNTAYKQIWLLLSISFALALVIILIIGSKIMSRFTKPVESAANAAIELAKGNYRARTYEDDNNEFGILSKSINILARNLQQITKEQEMQQDRLTTLIENMGTGLLLIDDRGCINLTNRTYKEIFGIKDHEVVGHSYNEVIKYKDICNIIDVVFMTEQKIRKQITIPIGIHMKNFEIYGAPIFSYHNEWKGIVIVLHDITELKRLEQIRKDFVANVSHELKTPITSIKGFAETLIDGAYLDEQALHSFLNIILKESDRLQSIISDLLELSRIEQHGFQLKLELVNIYEVIAQIMEMLRNKADRKSIELELIHDQEEYIIEGDSLRIKQIFINLLSNAISYTPQNGKVTIQFQKANDFIHVSITDTGIGIAREEIPRIFERFYRVDKDRSRNSGGTGLGLAIVKHLVEAHHGEIDVESELGKGSTFIVKLREKQE
ncbi:ATP-binding protein [Caldibacillus lycopersici]|uniref:histidine kinase n=1 Tax=Perspicuibacillus lycopersici TaxID=1325689 RepID=A0AAE3IVK7_9BACI|nr:ATP-binding protein [Perspicuibacillus lycopersici]MCU9614181.1 ATP-binding protein [Perspicuibacillus lycopersici]